MNESQIKELLEISWRRRLTAEEKRDVGDWLDRNPARRNGAERQAINAPLQGTAADIIKRAMISVHAMLGNRARILLQVHDELVFEVRDDAINTATETIRRLMEHTVELSVPLLVSIGIGQNWDEAH